jgi:RNA polymerase sigma-70 factor (ECF subfamily)
VARIYEVHADFVWASLQRLGVRDADLEDALQEVFVVVHRRLDSFDGSSKMTTWLFGIAMRVASAYRRRGFRVRETSVGEAPEPAPSDVDESAGSPEDALAAAQLRRRLDALLDELDVEKRAVFVMFEIDEMPCDEIAQLLGVPVGTVHSRLHAARREFQKALGRMHARDAHATAKWRLP